MVRESGIETLSYAIRPAVVLHLIGSLMLNFSLLSLVPLTFVLVELKTHHLIPCALTTLALAVLGQENSLFKSTDGAGRIEHLPPLAIITGADLIDLARL